MTTEELCANLKKSYDIVREASRKLWAVSIAWEASIDPPDNLEINVVRLPTAATTARNVSETLEVMRFYLFKHEKDKGRKLSDEEIKKICVIISKLLWLVYDLVEDIQRALAVDDSEYGTDLFVLSTAIAEMIGKFSQKDDAND